jgi:hypothetical protein
VRPIGVLAEGAREAWRLATNLGNAVSKVVTYDDRLMGVAEKLRDAKGQRYGMKLRRTQSTRAESVEWVYLLAGVALLLWATVGHVLEEEAPAVRLASKTRAHGSLWRASAPTTGGRSAHSAGSRPSSSASICRLRASESSSG